MYKFLLSVFDIHVSIIYYVKCTNKTGSSYCYLAIDTYVYWTTRRIHLDTFFQLLLQYVFYITAARAYSPFLESLEGKLLDCQSYT